ncbi:MnhB domain-containing protein [Elusimicrobiota bacterium]
MEINNKGMTEIVKTITSLVEGAILVYGLNIVLYGHISPGGGFAGGLILSFLFILLFLAYGKEGAYDKLNLKNAHILDSVGVMGFLFIGIMGIVLTGNFLNNFLNRYLPGKEFSLLSAGVIPLNNIAIGLKVAASVYLAFVILSVFKIGEEE